MSLDAFLKLVVDRADRQISFEFLECLFDLGELQVVFPHVDRIGVGHVGAEQVTAFAPPRYTQFVTVEPVGECGGLGFALAMEDDFDFDVAGVATGFFFCRAKSLVELVALERTLPVG